MAQKSDFNREVEIVTRGLPQTVPYNDDEALWQIAGRALRMMGDDAPDTLEGTEGKWNLRDPHNIAMGLKETGTFLTGLGFKRVFLVLREDFHVNQYPVTENEKNTSAEVVESNPT